MKWNIKNKTKLIIA